VKGPGFEPLNVEQTHDNVNHVFDPETETVPGNPFLEPTGVIEMLDG
jgi:hypothetical protein